MGHGSLLLALLLPSVLLAIAGLVFWWTLRWRSEIEQSAPGEEQMQQQFRIWRNRRTEEEMVLMLEELGWPKAVKKMTAEEVAHQLCIRLAEKLWNQPGLS